LASLIPGETLRILLITASESIQDGVREVLAARLSGARLYWVAQPDLAPTRAEDVLPHAVLVDSGLSDAGVPSLIRQLATRAPGAVILVLIDEGAMDQARDAMLAGARGFVTKPLQPDDLATTLRQVLRPRASLGGETPEAGKRADGQIAIFCAARGGTGRTTLAINTAVSLRMASQKSVALMDADYSAPALGVALSLDSARDVSDLLPRLSRMDQRLAADILATHASGIQVLLAPPPADLAKPISLPQAQQILVLLKRMFSWVIVDLGLPLDEMAYAFLDGADRIIMTILPEIVGLRNTRLMLDKLYQRGHPDEKVWLVLNRATMRGGITASDIQERLGVDLRHMVPDDQPLVTHSTNRGVPLAMSHKRSAVARSVRGLARQLVVELSEQEPKAGLVERLLGRARPGDG